MRKVSIIKNPLSIGKQVFFIVLFALVSNFIVRWNYYYPLYGKQLVSRG